MQSLKDQFDIPDRVHIGAGKGGLTTIGVTSPLASGEVYLHGAQVTAFTPARQKPVIWMSAKSHFELGKPIRGGVPICFPWFGPRAGDPAAPVHGFARLREWTIESTSTNSNGEVVIVLSLKSDDATRKIWPADFTARHVITFGSALQMKLEIRNTGGKPIQFEEALHTYIAVGDIRQTTVEGLAGTSYLDKVAQPQIRRQDDPIIRFAGETDRIYLDTQSTCIVFDPVFDRRIEIAKSGSDATVVWNPWINKSKAMPDFGDDEWPGMLCVETVNANKHVVELAPDAAHTMTATVRVL